MEMRRKTVLVVEDNEGDVRIVSEALSALDAPVEVVVAPTGYAAVDYIRGQNPYERAGRPDLILLDLNLPGLSGQQVLRIAKADAHARGIPIVVYSTAWAPQIVADCLRLADHYIVKPKTWAECLDAMRAVLRFLEPGGQKQQRSITAN